MSRRAIVFASAGALATLAACSVLTDFTGLTGSVPDPSANDAGGDSSIDAAQDSATDAAVSLVDSGSDAPTGDAGSWAFVGSSGNTGPTGPITVTAPGSIKVGDLVVFACDAATGAGTITIGPFGAMALTSSVKGPSLQAVAFWGISVLAIDNFMVTATPQTTGQFMDCSMSIYRGGTKATLVDHYGSMGTGAGLTSCHSVMTERGGLAYYIAARYSCAGTPVDSHFQQRQTYEGNPNGDFVPTDGTTVGTTLNDCVPPSTGDWICLMLSLSP